MSAVTIKIETRGIGESLADLQRLRNGLANRGPMHAQLAVDVKDFTRKYLVEDTRHATAAALGATPTGHRTKIGQSENIIEADSDAERAMLRIPRNTGLGRAFHDFDVKMRGKLMVRSASALTYGKSPRDFPEGVLKFGMINQRFPGLVFAADNSPAYFLMRKYHQDQDRTLLPSDEAYAEAGRRSTKAYLVNILRKLPA